MPIWKQKMLSRLYRNEAGEGGDGGNGGGAGGGTGDGGQGDGGGQGQGEGEKKPEGDKKPAGDKKPSDEEARLLKENMRRKDENAALKRQIEELQGLQSTLSELGGLDALKALVTEKRTTEEKQLEAKGDFERLKQRMADEHAKEVNKLKSQLDALNGDLSGARSQINELMIGGQFGQSKFISEDTVYTPAKARVLYGEHFELVDGKVVAYDKPKGAANRTAIVDSYGNPVGFDEALRKIVEADPERDYILKDKGKPGANSQSRQGEPKKTNADASGTAKIAAGLKAMNMTNV